MAGTLTDRVALILEYDGTEYSGWQYQINADTVQACGEGLRPLWPGIRVMGPPH